MSANPQTPTLSARALQEASRKAEAALRAAADQWSIVKRAAESGQWDAQASGSVKPGLRAVVRRVQVARELVEQIRVEMQALEAKVEPARREAADPAAPSTALPSPDRESADDEVSTNFRALLRKGALLESAAFLERAGFSRQALSKAVGARRLFYVEVGAIRGYPAFYVDPKLQRKQLEAVCKLLGDLPGGSKWLFFTTPKGSLAQPATAKARTPLEALAAGDFAKVRTAAIGYAQR